MDYFQKGFEAHEADKPMFFTCFSVLTYFIGMAIKIQVSNSIEMLPQSYIALNNWQGLLIFTNLSISACMSSSSDAFPFLSTESA